MNKCFYCEKETDNPPKKILNGYLEKQWVSFCDEHEYADESFEEELKKSARLLFDNDDIIELLGNP